MIIYLYGPDDYRREKNKKELVKRFEDKYGRLGLASFDLSADGDPARFNDFLFNQSIFNPYKLVVLRGIFELSAKDSIGIFKDFLENKSIAILIVEDINKKPPAAWNFLFKKPVLSYTFDHLKGPAWLKFIQSEAKERAATLTIPAVDFLARAYEGDSWRLVTELDKISFLSKKVIDKEDLESMDIEIAPDFWSLVNGLKSYDASFRFYTLEKIFSRSEPAAKIFNIIAYMWPEELRRFAEYDLAIKSGKMDYEEALVDVVL